MPYYDEIAGGYNALHAGEQLAKLRVIASHLNLNKSASVLDVGCGTGLSKEVFNCKITGIDPSEKLLEQCSFPVKKACAESIPLADNSFDVVIAVTCIHNFDDLEKGLREIKRVGKKRFALSVLKKSPKKEKIIKLISSFFCIEKVLDQEFDLIFFCS